MDDPAICSECNATLPAAAAEGLCTKCLLNVALEAVDAEYYLQVRCPHCRNAIELVDDAPPIDITCPSCDSKFSLAGDDAKSATMKGLTRLSQFELIEQVGIGGFGTVWKAHDTELDRVVAIKVPRRNQVSATDIEQFMREARAAAQLSHPNIVRVYEVGRSNDQVYIVSDFVDGATLNDWLEDHNPSPKETASLCVSVANALHHAHDSGVVHRDLKPSNIMVDPFGSPHIMDFGLAKRDAGEVTMTIAGKVLGTPAYMPPEQASGEGHNADARSDVYSLGVILFEMLTGETPFRGNSRMLLHHVLHEDAPSPRKLQSGVPQDMETICLKCLQKDPAKRYQSARDVSVELSRFLRGEPIQARPITSVGRLLRWCNRNRLVSSLATTLLASLIVGLIGVSVQWYRAQSHAARADKSQRDLRRHLYSAHMNLATEAWQSNNVDRVVYLLKEHLPSPDEEDLRGFEWYYLWNLTHRGRMSPVLKLPLGSRSVAVSSDGKTVVAGSAVHDATGTSLVGFVKVWDIQSQHVLRSWTGLSEITSVEFLPGTDSIVCGSAEGTIKVWNWKRNEELGTIRCAGAVAEIAVSPNGKMIAVAAGANAGIWDTSEYAKVSDIGSLGAATCSVEFSPDSKTLAVGAVDGRITLWDINAKSLHGTLAGHTRTINRLAFSPDGNLLASACWDSLVKVWDIESLQEVVSLEGHTRSVRATAFSPDGRFLATCSNDNTIKLWKVSDWRELDTLKGHGNRVYSLAFTPDSQMLVSASRDKTVRLWNVNKDQTAVIQRTDLSPTGALAFSPDSQSVIVSGEAVRSWNPETGTINEVVRPGKRRWTTFAMSPDGATLATGHVAAGGSNSFGTGRAVVTEISLRNAATGRILAQLGEASACEKAYVFSPDAKLLATANGPTIRLWDTENGTLRFEMSDSTESVYALAFSPDGKWLASGGRSSSVKLWDMDKRQVGATLEGHTDWIHTVAFSQDGRWLASAGSDLIIKLWNPRTGQARADLKGHSGKVMTVVFSPDGKRLVSAGHDQSIKIWDVQTTQEVATLRGHADRINWLTISPDGNSLASSGRDGRVILLRAASSQDVHATEW